MAVGAPVGLSRTACADCGGLVVIIRDRRDRGAEVAPLYRLPSGAPTSGEPIEPIEPIGPGAIALTVDDWRSRRALFKIRRSDEVVLCQHCRNRQARATAALERARQTTAMPRAVARYRSTPRGLRGALAWLRRKLRPRPR